MRLGDILIRDGVLASAQLAAALQHQVVYGGRLGTVLIELGYADQDHIAHGLAKLHGVPAALARHLARHDPSLAELVPRALVAEHIAFPLAYAMAGGKRLVVCMRDPQDRRARAAIAAAAGLEVVASAAPEIAIYYWLERSFGLRRPPRFIHARPGAASPLPGSRSDTHGIAAPPEDDDSIDVDLDLDEEDMPDELQLVDLDHSDVERDHRQYAIDSKHQESLLDLARRDPIERPGPVMSADEARAAIEAAGHRDEVADALLAFLRGHFAAGLVLVVSGDLALGHRGFGGGFDAESVETIVVPLSAPSVLTTAAETRRPFRGAPPDHGRGVQQRFFKLFQLDGPPSRVVVVPVTIRDRVVCLVYAHGARGESLPEKATAQLVDLAEDTAGAFVRLIKARKR